MRRALTFLWPLMLLAFAGVASTRDTQEEWWKGLVAACVLAEEGDSAGASEAWFRAVEAGVNPGLTLFQFGVSLGRDGSEEALDILNEAAQHGWVEARAHYEMALLHARNKDREATEAALRKAAAAGLCLPKGTLAKERAFKKLGKTSFLRALRADLEGPEAHYTRLAAEPARAEFMRFLRARNFLWASEEDAPAYLILEDVLALAKRVAGGSRLEEADKSRLLEIGRQADEAMSSDVFSPWMAAMAELDRSEAKVLLENWDAIGAQGPMFRGHRFKELMRRFVPVAKSAQAMGDHLGYLCAEMVLAQTRTCLVEYEVRGFDLEAQWRLAWEGIDVVKSYGAALGEWDAVVGAHELRVQLLADFPSEELRSEFLTANHIGRTYIELTIFDLRMPEEDRSIRWTAPRMRRMGLLD